MIVPTLNTCWSVYLLECVPVGVCTFVTFLRERVCTCVTECVPVGVCTYWSVYLCDLLAGAWRQVELHHVSIHLLVVHLLPVSLRDDVVPVPAYRQRDGKIIPNAHNRQTGSSHSLTTDSIREDHPKCSQQTNGIIPVPNYRQHPGRSSQWRIGQRGIRHSSSLTSVNMSWHVP